MDRLLGVAGIINSDHGSPKIPDVSYAPEKVELTTEPHFDHAKSRRSDSWNHVAHPDLSVTHLGVSENSVPLNPLVNDDYPY